MGKSIVKNKKAYFDYEILEEIEAGVMLTGAEVKSLRANRANLVGSYAKIIKNELWLVGANIPNNSDPQRTRKLLVHRDQIKKLIGKTQEKGLTLVALKIYFKKNHAKILIGIAKGKKLHDKREVIKRRDLERENRI